MIAGKKNKETFNENLASSNEWNHISNFVAANVENNEALESNSEKSSIPVKLTTADVSNNLTSFSADRDLTTTFQSMDKEFKEISINYQSLRSELSGLLDELEEIRGARESLQERLTSIEKGEEILH